ncbi:unnamed protein product [Arctia plantaginis]|uniref:gamma-glutamylcyclotransferase n=1 Tax=Arctia plantaginis TaxID=874455 RepID=A0A8S1B450_ARCPL|nr:unnamed protein product [Arctia plantaginis]CAB3256432.1 unnamed protein product [Arctia plantaginis]
MEQLLCFLTFISVFVDLGICKSNETFFYFAYGSNLLSKRIHINNPSAVYYSPAKLENHRLDFNFFVEAWNGAVSTIVEDDTEEVWGVLWTLNIDQMKYLDDQEGVTLGWYFPKNVTVTTPDGKQILARTYQETMTPEKLNKCEDLPVERRPSSTYLEVIALGAIESHLPADYIAFIFSFPSNAQMATAKRRNELGYPF